MTDDVVSGRGARRDGRTSRTWRERYEGSVIDEFAHGLSATNFADRIVLVGASLLLSVLPMVILLSAFASTRIDDDIARHLGLSQRASKIIEGLIHPSHGLTFNLAILISLVLSLAGTVTVATLIQAIYESAFQQPHLRSATNMARRVVWVACAGGLVLADVAIGSPVDKGPVGPELVEVVNLVAMVLFSWWSIHFLLSGRVPWRRLLRAALLTAVFWVGVGVVASVYFASTIESDSRLYGTIGVVFTLVTWFIALGAAIALGAIAGATWQSRAERRHAPTEAGGSVDTAEGDDEIDLRSSPDHPTRVS